MNVRKWHKMLCYSNASMIRLLDFSIHLWWLFSFTFLKLTGFLNFQVREYIDDTEDYVNIQLDNQRNELIQLQLILTIASFAIAVDTLIAGMFGMNIPCQLYQIHGIFGYFVGSSSTGCLFLFLLVLGYARWKKLLGS